MMVMTESTPISTRSARFCNTPRNVATSIEVTLKMMSRSGQSSSTTTEATMQILATPFRNSTSERLEKSRFMPLISDSFSSLGVIGSVEKISPF